MKGAQLFTFSMWIFSRKRLQSEQTVKQAKYASNLTRALICARIHTNKGLERIRGYFGAGCVQEESTQLVFPKFTVKKVNSCAPF